MNARILGYDSDKPIAKAVPVVCVELRVERKMQLPTTVELCAECGRLWDWDSEADKRCHRCGCEDTVVRHVGR